MAITLAGRRLTQAHSRSQAQIRAATLQQLARVWPTLDVARLDATAPGFITAASSIILGGRALSARAAALYLEQFRLAEGVQGRAPIVLDRPTSAVRQAISTSLLVTGPVAIKRAAAQGKYGQAVISSALALVSASAARHVQAGGWDTIQQTVQNDQQALGWARAASGTACAFCAMLASRGPVYREETADFEAHDGCGCGIEPVYGTGDYEWPENSREYALAWDAARNPDGFLGEYNASIEGKETPGPKSTKTGSARRNSELINGPFRAYLQQNR
ncbi:MAG: hypothetical protein ABFD96_17325 [Armatimonadia bacterium]